MTLRPFMAAVAMFLLTAAAVRADQPSIRERLVESIHATPGATILEISSGPTQGFHFARDSWFTQDKLFDHFAFAFALGQLSTEAFDVETTGDKYRCAAINLAPWVLKEIIDGFRAEGASYKDLTASAIGLVAGIFIH